MKSRSDCLKEYGSDYYIRQKVDSGELFLVEKGIYSYNENVPEIALIAFKYSKAVFTLDTAFYLYGLTDEIPDEYTLATKREAAPITDKRVKQIFMPKELLNVGLTYLDHEGYQLPIFNLERMLVELVRYKSKLPYNYYKEILGNYRRILPRLNVEAVRDYAEKMPKSNKIITTLRNEVF